MHCLNKIKTTPIDRINSTAHPRQYMIDTKTRRLQINTMLHLNPVLNHPITSLTHFLKLFLTNLQINKHQHSFPYILCFIPIIYFPDIMYSTPRFEHLINKLVFIDILWIWGRVNTKWDVCISRLVEDWVWGDYHEMG